MTIFNGQIGMAKETTYGTAVTVSRFADFLPGTDLMPVIDHVESAGIRPGRVTLASDMSIPVAKGAKGKTKFNLLTKGGGLWLEQIFGSISLGTVSGGKTPMTVVPAALAGKSFTSQFFKPYSATASGKAFTSPGCKVTNATFSASVDNLLEVDIDYIGRSITTATATATATYATTPEPFVWTSTTLTIGGSSAAISSFELTHDNALKADRFKMAAGGLMDEPLQEAFTKTTCKVSGIAWEASTHYDRFVNMTAASAQAVIVATFAGVADPTATLTITIPNAMAYDYGTGGDILLEEELTFNCLQPAGGSAVTLLYNTVDSVA